MDPSYAYSAQVEFFTVMHLNESSIPSSIKIIAITVCHASSVVGVRHDNATTFCNWWEDSLILKFLPFLSLGSIPSVSERELASWSIQTESTSNKKQYLQITRATMEIITPMDERPWSISSGPVSSTPRLTSSLCYDALVQLFQNESSLVLSVAAESSSHVSGVSSLYAQPWVYAGGGLGNIDECPLQVCLAGGTKRDSLTFASACVVPECDANDLHAPDFTARLEQASFQADTPQDQDIRQEYVNLHKRIAQVNHLLNTGWVCGEYKVAWEVLPSTIYILVLFGCLGFSIYSTFYRHQTTTTTTRTLNTAHYVQCASTSSALDDDDEEEEKKDSGWNECFEMKACLVEMSQDVNVINRTSNSFLEDPSFWDAWDMRKNLKKLTIQRPDTACLDGLKVGSILWSYWDILSLSKVALVQDT